MCFEDCFGLRCKKKEKIENETQKIDKQCKEGGGCCGIKELLEKHNSGVIVRWSAGRREETVSKAK